MVDALDQGGLASAVRAEDADEFPPLHFKTDVRKDTVVLVGEGEPRNFEIHQYSSFCRMKR